MKPSDAHVGELPVRQADPKRYWWLLSVTAPGIQIFAATMVMLTANPYWAFLAPVGLYGLVPLADHLLGQDAANPAERDASRLETDQWYRFLLFASIPFTYGSLFANAFAMATPGLPLWSMFLLAVSAGISSGVAITVGHELGHKPNRLDQFGAKLANAASGYAHFCIEHNRGHHVLVATPEDPASARLGESLYRFALREIPGTFVRGWQLERARLARKGLPFWHWRNDLLQGYAITLLITLGLVIALGWWAIPFMAVNCVVGWLHLTSANYVEHYGLLRERRPDGRHAGCEPRHSWNSNHLLSNMLLFHLQRHSDHHANPLRPYQVLRSFDDLPSLPSGYPGSFVLAALPPLWFRVMDPKVLDWAGGDIARTNLDPARAAWYRTRYGAGA